jgi:hypothetical protein
VNADLSVAPEIAQLAAPHQPAAWVSAAPRTDGRTAGDLADLAAAPERWWDLVRFDPDGPLRIEVPGQPGRWLLVLPPGAVTDCDCQQATAVAGEAVEGPSGDQRGPGRPLHPGRVLVHGSRAPHRVRAAGPGYAVTLHAAVAAPRSLSASRTGACSALTRPSDLAGLAVSWQAQPRSANSQPICGTLSGQPDHPAGVFAKSSPGVTQPGSAVSHDWERLYEQRGPSHD